MKINHHLDLRPMCMTRPRSFSLSDGWWLRDQVRYDTERAKDLLESALNKIRPWTEVVGDAAAHA